MTDNRHNGGIGPDSTTSRALASEPRGVRHPGAAVVTLSVALLGAAVLLLVAMGDPFTPLIESRAWTLPLVAAGVFVSFHVHFAEEASRSAKRISFNEIPDAFALVFLGPVPAIIGRLVGSAYPIISRRPGGYKLLLNTAMFTFEMSVGFTILRAFAGPGDPADAIMLLGVAVSLVAMIMISWAIVTVAISFFEGRLMERLQEFGSRDGWMKVIGAGIAITAVAPSLIDPWLTPFGLIPVATTWVVLREYGELNRRHRDVSALQGFTTTVGRSLSLDLTADDAVRELRVLLRAERASLIVFDDATSPGDDVGTVHVAQAGLPFTARTDRRAVEAYLWLARADEPYVLAPIDWPTECGPLPAAVHQLLIAPMHDEAGPVGLVILIDRQGALTDFDDSDLARVQSAAAQLRAALRNVVMHARLEHEANHDPLTGRPNRMAFSRTVDELLLAGSDALIDARSVSGIMVVGLDHLKEVTDTLGHQVRDRVILEIADRVGERLAAGDELAALDGNEFAVFARRRTTEELSLFAQSLAKATLRPVELDGLEVVITCSVGLALAEPEDDTATLLRHADVAMYHAKVRHTGFETYRAEIDRDGQLQNRLLMRGDLRDGLQRGEITVHYQPKLDVATGTIVGAEALARWSHPVRGAVSPTEFVSLAEETGLVKQLTDQVLSQAIDSVRGWREAGYGLGVAVNVSTHDLLDESLVERVGRLLDSHGVEPSALTLEITESSLLNDAPRTQATVNRLHDLGLRLAVDDFGTGYSSLSYLRRLPVAELKIDGSFVWNLLLDAQDEVIVRSTIDLGHNLGLQVVAEGVENAPVIRRLEEMGCDIAQGFSIARPLPPDQFRTWLATTDFRIRRIDFQPDHDPPTQAWPPRR